MNLFQPKPKSSASQNKTFGIIGLGRFGTALAMSLANAGYDIICLDKDEDRVKVVRGLTDYAYVVDTITKETLDEIGIRNCDVAIVCIGSAMDVNILTTLHLVNLKVPRVIAKATSSDQGMILEKLGAQVVYPEHDMAIRLAKKLMVSHLVDYFSLNKDTEIVEVNVPDALVGQSIIDIELRKQFGLNIIAIESGNQTMTNIDPHYVLKTNDRMVIIGKLEDIHRFDMAF